MKLPLIAGAAGLMLAACSTPNGGAPEITMADALCFGTKALAIVDASGEGWGSLTNAEKASFVAANVNTVADACGIDVITDEAEASIETALTTALRSE